MSELQEAAVATAAPVAAYALLKRRLQLFVDEYVQCGQGTLAAVRSGFRGTNARSWASKRLALPEVRAAIAERKAEAIRASGDKLLLHLRHLEAIGNFDERRLYADDGTLLPAAQWPDDVAYAMASFEVEELFAGNGDNRRSIGHVKRFKVWDKNVALRLLLQFHQTLPERHEVTGKDGQPLPPTTVYVISREEAKHIGQDLDEQV